MLKVRLFSFSLNIGVLSSGASSPVALSCNSMTAESQSVVFILGGILPVCSVAATLAKC